MVDEGSFQDDVDDCKEQGRTTHGGLVWFALLERATHLPQKDLIDIDTPVEDKFLVNAQQG